ncbi:MAG TPA: chemotaxis-specific protein-glutamate methyltransferase CheB [Pyrinomonadaceae bacterium]|nr:chemotaxis-specific protein-glutamate methyltransferase CheB [Pyrinomonadaceae bacterium]
MTYRLLIADDSPLYRLRLSQIFSASDRLQIVGLAAQGREAIALVKERRPDVLVLDLEMPELDGFSVLRWVMKNALLPVVVCSGLSERESVFRALEAGAVDFITKPELRHAIRSEEFAAHLRQRVEAAAEAHARAALPPAKDTESHVAVARLAQSSASRARACMVGIVGSAGSPAALGLLLSRLRRDFSVPVVVALHMPQGFTRSFAERLSRTTPFTAREARDAERIGGSQIYVAPGGHHTTVTGRADSELFFHIAPSSTNDFYTPSADKLLTSLAETCGEKALAVILTGMGEDGLRGSRAIKERGGRVIVESRDSALIWGMPRAVSEAGLADAELTPAAISAALPMLCSD